MKAAAALVQLGLGGCFGVALARSGAADFDAMVRMFRFEEAHLFLVAGVTTLTAWVGLFALLRSRFGDGVRVVSRDIHPGSVPGGVLFGIGWGVSGSCPGTVLAQIGSGHLIALVTLTGILLGNGLFERFAAGRFGLNHDSCG
jgi:uncharacterized membrane protein YedE/YeeE